jgi:hypothetical protein
VAEGAESDGAAQRPGGASRLKQLECALQACEKCRHVSTGDHKGRHHAYNLRTCWNKEQFLIESRFHNSSGIEFAIVSKHETLQKTPPSGLVQHVGEAFDQGFQSVA